MSAPEAKSLSEKIKWHTEPEEGTWPTSTWHRWESKCGNYRIYRIESQLESRPLLWGAVAIKNGTDYAIATDPQLGIGYPKYWASLSAALTAVEEYHNRRVKGEVTSNKRELLESAEESGLLTKSPPVRKSKNSPTKGVSTVKISREKALGLLKAVGFAKADKLNNEKLEAKLSELTEDEGEKVDAKWQDLFDKVINVNEKEGEITVFSEDKEEDDAPEKKKPGRKAKAASEDEEDGDDSDDEEEEPAPKKRGRPKKAAVASDEDEDEGGGTAVATKPKKRGRPAGSTDGSSSNKGKVYLAWKKSKDKSTSKAEDYYKLVDENVKLNTIRGWISAWNRGNNLPAVAK